MELESGEIRKAKKELGYCLEIYARFMEGRKLSVRTRIEYRNDLRSLVTFLSEQFGAASPGQVGQRELRSYLAHLGGLGFRRSTRRRKVAAIKGLFGFLSQSKIISQDSAGRLLPPERDQLSPRVLSDGECESLLATVVHEPRDRALLELLLSTGLRLSEVTRLSLQTLELPQALVGDVALSGRVTVVAKGASDRTVAVPYRTCLSIKTYLKLRPAPLTPHLFLNKFGRGMSGRAIEYVVSKYLEWAGIAGASVHTLRHTFATRLARQGATPEELREALGIADPRDVAAYLL